MSIACVRRAAQVAIWRMHLPGTASACTLNALHRARGIRDMRDCSGDADLPNDAPRCVCACVQAAGRGHSRGGRLSQLVPAKAVSTLAARAAPAALKRAGCWRGFSSTQRTQSLHGFASAKSAAYAESHEAALAACAEDVMRQLQGQEVGKESKALSLV